MAKTPHSPQEIFDEFSKELKDIYGQDLKSIILYGSGAKGDYIPKKSDINFLVILSEQGIAELHKSFQLVEKWQKRKVAVPLFMTESYIASSLDSFPIEFMSMKQNHKLVYGEDILANIEIMNDDLRLECEVQLKGKLLHLREGFLASTGKKRLLQELLAISVPSFTSIFEALLCLRKENLPSQKVDIFNKTAEVFELDKKIFESVFSVRTHSSDLSREELIDLTAKYITEIRKLASIIDKG